MARQGVRPKPKTECLDEIFHGIEHELDAAASTVELDGAVAGARVNSHDISTMGPREVTAKINNSHSPSGFHSKGRASSWTASRWP